jgi:hypothetical protein
VIDFYLKSLFVLLSLLIVLFLTNKYLERKRLLSASGVENFKVIPLGSGDRLIVLNYKGEEYLIFSTSHSAILLRSRRKIHLEKPSILE